jgi:Putative prokaryotic signal transducing protein
VRSRRSAIILVDMDRLVPIGTYATRSEAEIVEGLLESAGIAASIRADDAGGAYPFVLSGGAQVLVDESDAKAASQVLAEPTDEA